MQEYLAGWDNTKSELITLIRDEDGSPAGVINIESDYTNDDCLISDEVKDLLMVASKIIFKHMKFKNKNIFLSYAKEGFDKVSNFKSKLETHGFNAWIDEEDLVPGVDWDFEIQNKIKSAEVILVCLSKHSVGKRGYVQKEIKWAIDILEQTPENDISLIPVMLEECILPSKLASRQAVKLYTDNGLELLIKSLNAKLNNA